MKIPIIIDGHLILVDEGTPIIKAARKADIYIPTLCHHDALRHYGSCRLCMVELSQNRQKRLVTSCSHPVEPGMEVRTDTEDVKAVRRMLIRLLLARCPDVAVIRKMADRMGIETSDFKKEEDHHCVLCGLCTRFCEEVVGVSAIGMVDRGVDREVHTPFRSGSDACIGCGSCSYICPTGCIEMNEDPETGLRYMRMGKLEHENCPNQHRCEECKRDQGFVEEIARFIGEFRAADKRGMAR